MKRKRSKARSSTRPRRSRTQAEWIASLKWNIKDAREALHNAVDMSNWAGVAKYAKQLQLLERRLMDAGMKGMSRSRREDPHTMMTLKESRAQYEASERMRQRGRRGVP